MLLEHDQTPDFFLLESENIKSSLAPRIIILDPKGNFPLVPYKDTGWLGLPGGKAKEAEIESGIDFLSIGSFPILKREITEECGIDISDLLNQAACIGIAEINIVDSLNQKISLTYSPIFVCLKANLKNIKHPAHLVNIKDHLPGPIFPDARIALNRLKQLLKQKQNPITPIFLNQGETYYFQLKPQMNLLMGRPDWLTTKK